MSSRTTPRLSNAAVILVAALGLLIAGMFPLTAAAATDGPSPRGLVNEIPPEVGGVPRVRGYAYANYGRWNHSEYPDIEFSYQWLVDGEPEAGATDQMFEPRLRHLDAMLQVAVTAHHPDADPVQVVSAAKRVYPGVFHQSMPPTIYGFVIVGGSAKVQPRRWTPRPQSIEYRWFIKRPDASRYRPLPRLRNKKEFPLRRRHAGSRIKVRVIVSRPGFHKARARTPRRTVGWSRTNGVKTINGVPCHTC